MVNFLNEAYEKVYSKKFSDLRSVALIFLEMKTQRKIVKPLILSATDLMLDP